MRLPSPALVIATIALFVALSGTAWAVTQLPRNSVGPQQLRNNAVTGPKVKDGSLGAEDFKGGALPAGPKGDAGPAGPAGPQGAQGPAGADAVSDTAGVRLAAGVTMPADNSVDELLRLSSGGQSLVLTRRSRVTAWFTVGMYKLGDDASERSRVLCGAYIENPADPTEDQQLTVPLYEMLIPAPAALTIQDGFITATGSRVLPAGTYDPYVVCKNFGDATFTGIVQVYGAALDVIVAPD